MSCLLLAKLLTTVINALNRYYRDFNIYCWTDSIVALCWIKGFRKEWKPWVEHRVTKIRNTVSPDNWYHVPGNLNPADVSTRNASKKDLAPGSC